MSLSVAILAGGLGTRLRSVLPDTPKPLAPINGTPFITRLLNQLSGLGVTEVILCTGHLADNFSDCLGSRYGSISLTYSVERLPLGTAGALRLAAPLFQGDLVLALNGDSFVNFPLRQFTDWYGSRADGGAMVLARVENTKRFGTVSTDEQGNVTSFLEKQGGAGCGWINAGVYLFPRAWISELPANATLSLERAVLPAWLSRGIRAYRTEGPFIDIGTPESLNCASKFAYE